MITSPSEDVLALGIKPILIEEELKESFLEYAMSVIVSRALPDIRDGLKPVHRRVLYTMYQLGFWHTKPYHKSVRVVGDVLGKYHPHGDQAVYNSMVGLVQEFSKRYPILDGQGNWGSVDGDNAAAMRYTEVRMMKIAQELLADLDKDTVSWTPNFDDSTIEPVVLPSKLPTLLANGTAGIAVGMATSIPPHNLGELLDACSALLENPLLSDDELFSLIPAPDFPTGGIICGRAGIVKAYKTGRGNLTLRAIIEVEENKRGQALVVTELPYQVNKAELIIKIADLVKNKVIEGIANIRDESNKKGIRLVIEIKKNEIPQVILNQLYTHTALQHNISILMLGLLDNKPQVFSLRDLIKEFLQHRYEVVYKRTQYDLKKAQTREHILAGLIKALTSIDAVIALIKASRSADQAIDSLHAQFDLSTEQAKALLEMRLQRLTGLEQEKVHTEINELAQRIDQYRMIMHDRSLLQQEIAKELEELKQEYADKRRSRIEGSLDILTEADLIPVQEVVVTLTSKGYVKRVPLEVYGIQHRGGKGKMGMAALEESGDIIQDVFVAKTHHDLYFFTNTGRLYILKVFEVNECSRTAKGRAVVNLLALAAGETVVKMLAIAEKAQGFLVMLSKNGIIKRTEIEAFANTRKSGIRAVTLKDDDELIFCALSSGEGSIVIATAQGQGIRFNEQEVRAMGRQASGVIGIRMRNKDHVVGMQVVNATEDILFATQKGYGKRVSAEDFRVAHRGGFGVRTIPTEKRNGSVIGLTAVDDQSTILLIDTLGKIIRLSPQEIRTMGRQAKGVRLIRLEEGQILSTIAAFNEQDLERDGTISSNTSTQSEHSSEAIIEPDQTIDNEY